MEQQLNCFENISMKPRWPSEVGDKSNILKTILHMALGRKTGDSMKSVSCFLLALVFSKLINLIQPTSSFFDYVLSYFIHLFSNRTTYK